MLKFGRRIKSKIKAQILGSHNKSRQEFADAIDCLLFYAVNNEDMT